MSLYRQQKTMIKDAGCLIAALRKMGRNPVRHSTAVHLHGYKGDVRQETAEVVIPQADVGSYSNDIGFKRQDDGTFQAIVSEYDRRTGYNDAWLKRVAKTYAELKIQKIADEQGLEFESRQTVNGKIHVNYLVRGAR